MYAVTCFDGVCILSSRCYYKLPLVDRHQSAMSVLFVYNTFTFLEYPI